MERRLPASAPRGKRKLFRRFCHVDSALRARVPCLVTFARALPRAKEVTVSRAGGGWKASIPWLCRAQGSYRQSRGGRLESLHSMALPRAGRLEASIPWLCRAQGSYLKTADAHGVRYLRGMPRQGMERRLSSLRRYLLRRTETAIATRMVAIAPIIIYSTILFPILRGQYCAKRRYCASRYLILHTAWPILRQPILNTSYRASQYCAKRRYFHHLSARIGLVRKSS